MLISRTRRTAGVPVMDRRASLVNHVAPGPADMVCVASPIIHAGAHALDPFTGTDRGWQSKWAVRRARCGLCTSRKHAGSRGRRVWSLRLARVLKILPESRGRAACVPSMLLQRPLQLRKKDGRMMEVRWFDGNRTIIRDALSIGQRPGLTRPTEAPGCSAAHS